MLMPADSSLALAERVVAEDGEAASHETHVQELKIGLELRVFHPVAGGMGDRRVRPLGRR